jgi:hypothetical protein
MKGSVVCFRLLLAASLFWLVAAASARAGFIVTGGDANVTAGSMAIVTFAISDTSFDELADFQLQLQLTGTSGNAGVLQFGKVDLVNNSYNQVNPFSHSNYVFYNNSFDQSYPPSGFWENTTSTSGPGGLLDLATGGDSANSGSTSFPGNYLLATVQVDATSAVAGDTYQIALASANTYFQDPNGDNLSYSSTAASVTIVSGVSAVPAPPSLVLAGIGSLTCMLYYGWISRRKAPLLRRSADA